MKWLKWHKNDSVELEERLLKARSSRLAEQAKTPAIKAETQRLIEFATRNHFGDAIALGLMLRNKP
jgi:hypothetical protein